MKLFMICSLLLASAVVYAEPEWQIFFPEQAADIGGHYVDHNQALVVKTVDNLVFSETLNLADYTGISIPDNTAVTGFTSRDNGGPANTASFLFSLSTTTSSYLRGDVIECNLNGCSLFETFDQNASLSALDYNNSESELYVSFDTGFSVAGEYITPLNAYQASDFSLIYDGSTQSLGDNNSITALDGSDFNFTISPLRMYNSIDGLVKPSDVYSTTIESGNAITAELSDKVSGINAYFSLDSGWLEFRQNTINVSESAGVVTFNVDRIDGSEGKTSVVVRDVDGTAVDGVDYVGLLNQYFLADGNDQTISISLILIDNNFVDGTRTFTVDLIERNSDYSFSLVNPNKNLITINIIDDDAGDLIFADDFE
jgi:hypothetical protein